MRSYVVGDIHGRLDLLLDALGKATVHNEGKEARFICTGDMIDRGSFSAGVVKTFRRGRISNLHLIALQGNHESMMVEVMGRTGSFLPHQLDWWAGNGGVATMESYGVDISDVPMFTTHLPAQMQDDIAWLRCLPTFFTEDPHRIYVHGGMMLISRHDGYLPMAKQDKDVCQWLTSDRVTDYGPFEGRHIVHGHMQFEDGPILLTNRTNLDTYAWKTGRLAIGVFDDDVPGGPIEILWAEGPPWQR
jgi:serine/threonine protein phosphatase 1